MTDVATAEASQRLAQGCFLDADFEGARQHLEAAFRVLRAAGEARAAARAAAGLAELHGSCLGNPSAAQGWASRGRRLLEPLGRCVELGYLALAVVACEVPDVTELLADADLALNLAIEFGDSDLEVRALADSGYALVVHGRLRGGFARLDEAMAALSAGEVQNLGIASSSYCALLSACDRAGDVRRAEEWSRVVTKSILDPLGGKPGVLHAHCRLAFGSVLCSVGRWPEGEAAIQEVLALGDSSLGHRGDAATRLAGLRLLQGRFEDAEQLLRTALDRPSAAEPRARLHLLTGSPELAAVVAERELDAVPGDRLRTAALLGVLVEAELACGRDDRAADWGAQLASLVIDSDNFTLRAEVDLAAARVAAARGEQHEALQRYRLALDCLGEDRPLVSGIVTLEVAEVLASAKQAPAAIVEAERARAVFDRLGAKLLADRSDALLRSLGSRSRGVGRAPSAAMSALSGREREVLALLRDGLTNAEIGARLFISPKTAEHHVGQVLAKLGVRSRAEAAAFAAAHGVS